MILSANDHVEVGIGRLYSPPFLGRFLLYRLFDINHTILICHQETGSVSASKQGNMAAMVAKYAPPAIIYAHCCFESAFANVDDLLSIPPVELPVPGDAACTERFKNLDIRLEQYNLALTEKLMVAYQQEPQRTMRIENTNYRVSGPINVVYWPTRIQAAHIVSHCIKVSLYNRNNKRNYDLESIPGWELSALDMEETGQPPVEVALKADTPDVQPTTM